MTRKPIDIEKEKGFEIQPKKEVRMHLFKFSTVGNDSATFFFFIQ